MRTLSARRALEADKPGEALEHARAALAFREQIGGDRRLAALLVQCVEISVLALLDVGGSNAEARPSAVDLARQILNEGLTSFADRANVLRLRYQYALIELSAGRHGLALWVCDSALEEDERLQADPDLGADKRLAGPAGEELSPRVFRLLAAAALMEQGALADALRVFENLEAPLGNTNTGRSGPLGAGEAQYYEALCLMGLGRTPEAFQKALAAAGNSGHFFRQIPAARRSLLAATLGANLLDAGLAPDAPVEARAGLAGLHKKALSAAQQALKLDPQNPDAAALVLKLEQIKLPQKQTFQP